MRQSEKRESTHIMAQFIRSNVASVSFSWINWEHILQDQQYQGCNKDTTMFEYILQLLSRPERATPTACQHWWWHCVSYILIWQQWDQFILSGRYGKNLWVGHSCNQRHLWRKILAKGQHLCIRCFPVILVSLNSLNLMKSLRHFWKGILFELEPIFHISNLW